MYWFIFKQKINAYRSKQPKKAKSSAKLSSLPNAGMKDSKLEAELVSYFNTLGWKEKFYKTIITNYEWNYRKSTAGIIVSRTLGVAMVSKKPNNTCMYQNFTIIQQKTPNGFGRSTKLSVGNQKKTSCK